MTEIYDKDRMNCHTNVQQLNTLFEMGKQLEDALIESQGTGPTEFPPIYDKTRMNKRTNTEQLNELFIMGKELEARYGTDATINITQEQQDITQPIYRKERMNCRTNVQQMNVLFEMGKELEEYFSNKIGVQKIIVDGVEYLPDENGNISITINAVKTIIFDGDEFIPNQDGTVSIESDAVKMVNINGVPFYPDENGDLYATVDSATRVIDRQDFYQLVCEIEGDVSTLVFFDTYWLLTTNNLIIEEGIYNLSSSQSLTIVDEQTNYLITC